MSDFNYETKKLLTEEPAGKFDEFAYRMLEHYQVSPKKIDNFCYRFVSTFGESFSGFFEIMEHMIKKHYVLNGKEFGMLLVMLHGYFTLNANAPHSYEEFVKADEALSDIYILSRVYLKDKYECYVGVFPHMSEMLFCSGVENVNVDPDRFYFFFRCVDQRLRRRGMVITCN